MEIRDKEDFCFIKTSAAIALVGRTQRVVVLKTGGQFPDPRLSAFEPLPAWQIGGFYLSPILVVIRFYCNLVVGFWLIFSKIVFGTCHCCSYSGKILKSQSATCDILTWHLVHCSFCLFGPSLPELNSENIWCNLPCYCKGLEEGYHERQQMT